MIMIAVGILCFVGDVDKVKLRDKLFAIGVIFLFIGMIIFGIWGIPTVKVMINSIV